MRVGVPREIKIREYRVGLTPTSVRELTAHGHAVLVETGAGAGIGADDDAYARAGATIASDAAAVFAAADLIVKVKEPLPVERKLLRADQVLFTYLHLAPDPAQAKDLMASKATCIAYETVTSPTGTLPLLAPILFLAGMHMLSHLPTASHVLLVSGLVALLASLVLMRACMPRAGTRGLSQSAYILTCLLPLIVAVTAFSLWLYAVQSNNQPLPSIHFFWGWLPWVTWRYPGSALFDFPALFSISLPKHIAF